MPKFVESLAVAATRARNEEPSIMLRNVLQVFNQFGLPREMAVEFLQVVGNQLDMENDVFSGTEYMPDSLPAQTQRPPMTAEERKAADKKRRRELEKKKKRQ